MKLLRLLSVSSRAICLSLHTSGIFESAKQHLLLPFTAGGQTFGSLSNGGRRPNEYCGTGLNPERVRRWQSQQLCLAAAVLACWRVSLSFGIGTESFDDLSLHLQAFAGHVAGTPSPAMPIFARVGNCQGIAGDLTDMPDAEERERERALELVASVTLLLAQTALMAAAGNRGVTWNAMIPWLSVAKQVGHATLRSRPVFAFLNSTSTNLTAWSGDGVDMAAAPGGCGQVVGGQGLPIPGLWVLAAAIQVY